MKSEEERPVKVPMSFTCLAVPHLVRYEFDKEILAGSNEAALDLARTLCLRDVMDISRIDDADEWDILKALKKAAGVSGARFTDITGPETNHIWFEDLAAPGERTEFVHDEYGHYGRRMFEVPVSFQRDAGRVRVEASFRIKIAANDADMAKRLASMLSSYMFWDSDSSGIKKDEDEIVKDIREPGYDVGEVSVRKTSNSRLIVSGEAVQVDIKRRNED